MSVATSHSPRRPQLECLRRDERVLAFRVASATSALVDSVDVCREFLHERGVGDCSGPAVVFRELLVNAMVHGNRASASRKVAVELEDEGGGRFRFCVQDEGKGFNAERVQTRAVADGHGRIQRRGYVLVCALSERQEFNEKGNRVTVWLRTESND